jgi:hypothetical protein
MSKHTNYLLLAAFALCFTANTNAQKIRFADQALLGMHVGYDRDYIGEWDVKFEESLYYGARAGLSLNNWLFGGIQARYVSARNFETPWQNFYMAGVWGRGYFLRPGMENNSGRLGLFLESGFMVGNFSFDNVNSFEYYIQRPGQWYIPIIAGIECRLVKNLTLEASAQGYYNSGRNWDQYGFAYMSLGLNYYLRSNRA